VDRQPGCVGWSHLGADDLAGIDLRVVMFLRRASIHMQAPRFSMIEQKMPGVVPTNSSLADLVRVPLDDDVVAFMDDGAVGQVRLEIQRDRLPSRRLRDAVGRCLPLGLDRQRWAGPARRRSQHSARTASIATALGISISMARIAVQYSQSPFAHRSKSCL
jgi:hypothetical protein